MEGVLEARVLCRWLRVRFVGLGVRDDWESTRMSQIDTFKSEFLHKLSPDQTAALYHTLILLGQPLDYPYSQADSRQPGWNTTILDQTVFRNQTPIANDQRSNAAFSAECRSHLEPLKGLALWRCNTFNFDRNWSTKAALIAFQRWLLSVGRDQQLPSSRWVAATLRSYRCWSAMGNDRQ